MQVFARFVSYALHPLFMPLYTLMLCIQFDPYLQAFLPKKAVMTLYGIIVVNTIIIPLATLVYLKKKKLIPNYELKERNDRNLPYFMTFLYYLLTYMVLRRTGLPEVIFSLLLTGVIGTMLVFVINFYWKISAHAIGIGGLFGAILGLSMWHASPQLMLLATLWILVGVVGSARLYLKAHTPAQVYAGLLLSFGCSFLLVTKGWYL